MRQYVILGCGPAGCAAAKTIREEDPDAQITMVSREFSPFYLRPALVDFVIGSIGVRQLVRPDPDISGDPRIEVRAGHRVHRVYPHESRVLFSDGTSLYFDRLLLATGASPRLSDYAARLRNKVHTLACHADAVRLARLPIPKESWVLVTGAGYTGVEVLRAFAGRGCQVVYLTTHTRFWSPRSPVARGDVLRRLLSEKVEVLFDEAVLDVLDLNGAQYRVITSSRRAIDVAAVCEARELMPSVDYLEGSGLVRDRGVVVDRELRTNFDNIFAAGDVAQVFDSDGNWHRVNFGWESAARQGAVAGHNLVHGAGAAVEGVDAYFQDLSGRALLQRWSS